MTDVFPETEELPAIRGLKPITNMASICRKQKVGKATYKFQIFNCDKTCGLDQVESLLRAVEKKVDFKITVEKQPFWGHEKTNMVDKTIPQLPMDFAVFLLHANDSLSFNEDCYGKIYNALKQRTGSGRTTQLDFVMSVRSCLILVPGETIKRLFERKALSWYRKEPVYKCLLWEDSKFYIVNMRV